MQTADFAHVAAEDVSLGLSASYGYGIAASGTGIRKSFFVRRIYDALQRWEGHFVFQRLTAAALFDVRETRWSYCPRADVRRVSTG